MAVLKLWLISPTVDLSLKNKRTTMVYNKTEFKVKTEGIL